MILEAAPKAGYSLSHTSSSNRRTDDDAVGHLFVFSARSQISLAAYMSSFVDYLKTTQCTTHFAKDLAFTLGERRTHFPCRIAVSAASTSSLQDKLQTVPTSSKVEAISDPIIAYTFTGQGAQYYQMAVGLRKYNEFEQALYAADRLLLQLGCTWSLVDELEKDERETRINEAEISQPACTAIQLALVILLQSWGVFPAAVVGHSSGEIAAAFAADIVTFEHALAISYFRGVAAGKLLMDATLQGAMLSIGTSPEEAEKLFPKDDKGDAVIAAVNSYNSVTVSGDVSAIEFIEEQAREQGLFVRRLKVDLAYHSPHMERIADSYLTSIHPFCSSGLATSDDINQKPLFVSSVTGKVETAKSVDTHYWIKNLLQPVNYMKAVETLFSGCGVVQGKGKMPNILVEIGPHSALQSPSKHILNHIASNDTEGVVYLPSLVRGQEATISLLNLAGKLFTMGLSVSLNAINMTKHPRGQVVSDLPPYEWNKTVRYLHHPRIATQKLYGGATYNRLLGWKSPYSEGNEQSFRNVFTLDDLPWIRDHVVTGEVLFPFTGFVALAIEGFRSLNTTMLQGVIIQELHVTTSLRIEEDQPVDITTKFRPAKTGTSTHSSSLWTFEILSWSGSLGWTQHSYGLIEADYINEPFSKSLAVHTALKTLKDQTLRHHDAQEEYVNLRDRNGITYGPAFRNAVDFWQGPRVSVHTIILRQLEPDTCTPSRGSPVTVDPATLDTFFHSLGVIQDIKGSLVPTIVPSFALQWRMSNNIAADPGQRFSIVSRCLSHDEKSDDMEMDFVVFDVSGSSPEPVAEIGPLKMRCISRPTEDSLRLPHSFSVKDVPYVDLIDPSVLSKMVEGDAPDKSELSHRHDLDKVAIHFLSCALKEEYDLSCSPPHMADFLGWAKQTSASYPSSPISDATGLIDRISASNATGELVCVVGAQLPAILRGEKQPLEIMLEDGLLWRTYVENVAGIRGNLAVAGYVGRLAECNAELNILELGAGTASATLPILEAIDDATKGVAPQFTYTFTDISAGFFDKAQDKLSQWEERLNYSKLDISQDPLSQGFNAESFDVIIASNVLHATLDIGVAMTNVRTLLRPGGKLVLMEAVNKPPPSFLPYALLPGWWLFGDSYRTDGPLLTKELWNTALEENGFSGLEGSSDDYPGQPEQLFSALWSSRCDQNAIVKKPDSVTIFQCSPDEDSASFSKVVSDNIENQLGCITTVKYLLSRHERDDDSLCIVLDSQKHSIFSDLTSELFYKLKDLIINCARLLWILPENVHPDAALIKGMLRTVRLELPTSKLVLLETPLSALGVGAITRLAQHILWDHNSAIRMEQEYSLVGNIIHVPRLQLVEAPRDIFALEAGLSRKSEQKIYQVDKALEMTVDTVGSPDSICFRQSSILDTDLGDDEIIVRVVAAGINFIDLLLVLGSLPWSPPGLEGAGIVAHVGSRVDDLQVGDRVFYAVDKAGMANLARMPSLCAQRIPVHLDLADAASMPIAFCTAMLSLIEAGHLQRGESVLIHSASGATGQACIMIAQHVGAQVFATAGTVEKREFLAQTFGIPTSHIFSSRTPDFKQGVLQATNNRGVDVILNCLSGHLLQHTWELIAENGRFIEIGKKDFLENNYLPMRPFIKNVTFSGVDLRRIINTRPSVVKEWLSTIVRLLEYGKITPIRPITTMHASQISMGLRKLQAGHNIGKIVIKIEGNENVLIERPSPLRSGLPASELLQPDATYLIAGGTGGIGRALVPWMISKGARNVVMLGRSASSNPKVKKILQQYEGSNVRVRAIPCDAGSHSDMIWACESLGDLPRVRGVVHSAICLRVSCPGLNLCRSAMLTAQQDAIFSNTEFEDWRQTTSSKVRVAWNLHELFPNLDFFVSLSGMTGIVGNRGQSVYTGTSVCSYALIGNG